MSKIYLAANELFELIKHYVSTIRDTLKDRVPIQRGISQPQTTLLIPMTNGGHVHG